MNENTRKKAILVQELVKQNYEPGRQDKCLRSVYRHHVIKVYPMCERTFWRYVHLKLEPEKPKEDKNQLKLFE